MLDTRKLKGFENMEQINIIYLSFHGRTCLNIIKLDKFHQNWRYSYHHWCKRHLVTRLTTIGYGEARDKLSLVGLISNEIWTHEDTFKNRKYPNKCKVLFRKRIKQFSVQSAYIIHVAPGLKTLTRFDRSYLISPLV